MNSPQRPDGPPVRDGKPYSAIAHLAENVTPFVAMAQALRARGFSAPAIFAADRAAGLLILEDLGSELVVAGEPPAPIEPRYEVAADLLAALHRAALPERAAGRAGRHLHAAALRPRGVPDRGRAAARLVSAAARRQALRRPKRDAYVALWREALAPALAAPPTWVLRDFHSPNLLWLPEREGIARIGLLDFQDAVMGPAAYDLASLLQDARVDVPELMEIALLSRYTRARRAADPTFDAPAFAQHLRHAGGAARLQDPRHLRPPRPRATASRNICVTCRAYGPICSVRWRIPALAPLAAWYRVNVPALEDRSMTP